MNDDEDLEMERVILKSDFEKAQKNYKGLLKAQKEEMGDNSTYEQAYQKV